ncbi:integrase catalytic domain-containing protein [Trichonephila clavata]|uniref:Integrase catalytic domain-containing protein n=1 Tax=Trichonephila clavata TaxID=2740835 RepID=A0A8X6KEB3_TRICU|nr:integrase catalytic domain-containing protein [Trichonephila clavata]
MLSVPPLFVLFKTNHLQKRWFLCCIGSFYDPLGLFSPLTTLEKILFQDTWVLRITWEEILPPNLATLWFSAVKELDNIHSIQIPRFIDISSNIPFAVHVFCDASERANGSVLYSVPFKGDQSNVHLVCCRNRPASIRKVNLPCVSSSWWF